MSPPNTFREVWEIDFMFSLPPEMPASFFSMKPKHDLTSGCFDSLENDGAGINYSTEDTVRITPFSDAALGHRV